MFDVRFDLFGACFDVLEGVFAILMCVDGHTYVQIGFY